MSITISKDGSIIPFGYVDPSSKLKDDDVLRDVIDAINTVIDSGEELSPESKRAWVATQESIMKSKKKKKNTLDDLYEPLINTKVSSNSLKNIIDPVYSKGMVIDIGVYDFDGEKVYVVFGPKGSEEYSSWASVENLFVTESKASGTKWIGNWLNPDIDPPKTNVIVWDDEQDDVVLTLLPVNNHSMGNHSISPYISGTTGGVTAFHGTSGTNPLHYTKIT